MNYQFKWRVIEPWSEPDGVNVHSPSKSILSWDDMKNFTPGSQTVKFCQEIAYLGEVGSRRKKFCVQLRKHKRKAFREFKRKLQNKVSENGQSISCHKGCVFCCDELNLASLGECELIVFYLYNNRELMSYFLNSFSFWFMQ